ncbi:MAG TPA: MOSC domain-containing protein [Terriglobales bacterium]|nr:MOSC domain-containing protein [Terriglobales bacterium]
MWKGMVVAIHIAANGGEAMNAVDQAKAIAGRGLSEDRYLKRTGTFCQNLGPSNELTFIESEAIEALKRDYGIELAPGESRRNITTSGVPLNHLVGREFRVGQARARGLRLCEPCSYLEKATGKGVIAGLKHRGGLRAQIIADGEIRVGDAIQEA